MELKLRKNTYDENMVEAYNQWIDKNDVVQTRLAFVMHIDDLEDDDVLSVLKNQGEAFVNLTWNGEI